MSIPVQPDWPQPSHPHLIEVRHNPSTSPSPSSPTSSSETATEFNTPAHSLISLPPGALFTPLTSPPLTLTTTKAYSSIQLSKNEHAELHSDLLYVNHSCEPSLVFDMAKREVRVAARKVRVASRPSREVASRRVASGPGRVEGQEEQEEKQKEQEGKEQEEQQEEGQQEHEETKERGLEPGDELTFFYPSSEWSMAQPFECHCGAGEGVCKGWIGGAKEMGRERMRGMWLNAFIEELLDEQEREAAAKDVEEAEATAAATVKDVQPTAAQDGDGQPTSTVKEERSKRTERKGSCNVQ